MPAYALSPLETDVLPPAKTKVKHVCGEKLTPVKGEPGRYTCTRCLHSGFLLLTA